jgi:hypothetical protein
MWFVDGVDVCAPDDWIGSRVVEAARRMLRDMKPGHWEVQPADATISNGTPMVVDDNSRLPNASALATRRQARADYDSGDCLTLATPADIAAYQPERHE